MTETDGAFGHLNMSPRAFFAHRVLAIEPVAPESVADFAPGLREHACIWGGDQGWISLAG